jgi:nucleoside-triphosphatase
VKLVLTGAPRTGKSTLLRRLAEAFPGNAGGFVVTELRSPAGRRCGFALHVVWRTPDTRLTTVQQVVLAHEEWPSPLHVGRYGVNPEALAVAVRALDSAMHEGALVLIDEIGPLQLLSEAFHDAVLRCLDSRCPMVATLGQATHPFVHQLRSRPGVRVLEVSRQNRDALARGLATWLAAPREGVLP